MPFSPAERGETLLWVCQEELDNASGADRCIGPPQGGHAMDFSYFLPVWITMLPPAMA